MTQRTGSQEIRESIRNAKQLLKDNPKEFFRRVGDALFRAFMSYQIHVGWWRTIFALGVGGMLALWTASSLPFIHGAFAAGDLTKGEYVAILLLVVIIMYLVMQNIIAYIDRLKSWVYRMIFADYMPERGEDNIMEFGIVRDTIDNRDCIVTVPFTEDQVKSLNEYQNCADYHPYTCTCGSHIKLIATVDGWVCPNCPRKQNWAHKYTADWEWKEFEQLMDKEFGKYRK